jgi:hypothetical protein
VVFIPLWVYLGLELRSSCAAYYTARKITARLGQPDAEAATGMEVSCGCPVAAYINLTL